MLLRPERNSVELKWIWIPSSHTRKRKPFCLHLLHDFICRSLDKAAVTSFIKSFPGVRLGCHVSCKATSLWSLWRNRSWVWQNKRTLERAWQTSWGVEVKQSYLCQPCLTADMRWGAAKHADDGSTRVVEELERCQWTVYCMCFWCQLGTSVPIACGGFGFSYISSCSHMPSALSKPCRSV